VKIEKENSIKTSIISWNKIGTLKHMTLKKALTALVKY